MIRSLVLLSLVSVLSCTAVSPGAEGEGEGENGEGENGEGEGEGVCVVERCVFLPGEDCTVDAGCAPRNDETYLCVADRCQRATGEESSACIDGGDCNSGICHDDECSEGDIGDVCAVDVDCVSEVCFSGQCRTGFEQSPCSTDDDCIASYQCGGGFPIEQCQLRAPETCAQDADCPRGGCFEGDCVEGGRNDGCDSSADCGESLLFGDLVCFDGSCSTKQVAGASCNVDDPFVCESNRCVSNVRQ